MIDECKELEKKGKEMENKDPDMSAEYYKRSSDCYGVNLKEKEQRSTLERAAKIMHDAAKSKDDPVEAEQYYIKCADLFKEIVRDGDAEKVMEESVKKYLDAAKSLRSKYRNSKDLEDAEKQLKTASEYALKGSDEQLSKDCWVDSGNLSRKSANDTSNPRQALEVYKSAIQKYRNGSTTDLEMQVWNEAADKFASLGSEIIKSNKELVYAFDNYSQAKILYEKIKSDENAKMAETKINEICEKLGITEDFLKNYLVNQKKPDIELI